MTPQDFGIRSIPLVFTAVIVLYFIFLMYLGKMSYNKSKSLSDFFVMGGSAGMLVGGVGYFATQYSMSTFQGVPGSIYNAGWMGLAVTVPTAAFSLLIPALLAGFRLMDLGRKYGYLTLGDYFEDRFDSKMLRSISAILAIVFLIPFVGAQTIGAGAILNTFTGAPFWVGVVIMGIGVTIYCALGGMRGAMYTNVLQGVLMVLTAIATFIGAIKLSGGFTAANSALLASNPGAFTAPGSPTKWMIYGNYASQLILWNLFTLGQPQLATKFFLMKNKKALAGAMVAAGIGMFLSTFFIYSSAVVTMVGIPGIPPALKDWVVPIMVSRSLPAVVSSLLMAGLLAAGMSTIDSVVVMVSGAFSRNIYQKLINPNASEESVLKLSRYAIFAVGILATIFGLLQPSSIFQIVLFTFAGLGIQTVTVLLGVRWKRCNKQGAIAGLIVGVATVIYLVLNPTIFPGWNAALPASVLSLIVTVVVSLATKPTKDEVLRRHFEKSGETIGQV